MCSACVSVSVYDRVNYNVNTSSFSNLEIIVNLSEYDFHENQF